VATYIQHCAGRLNPVILMHMLEETVPKDLVGSLKVLLVFWGLEEAATHEGAFGLRSTDNERGEPSGAPLRATAPRASIACRWVDTEVEDEKVNGLCESLFQCLAILRAPHSEVWEVVQHLTEEPITVAGVGARIQDVRVPELVNRTCRADLPVRVADVEGEELAVKCLHLVAILWRPIILLRELAPQHAEIEFGDASEGPGQVRVQPNECVGLLEGHRLIKHLSFHEFSKVRGGFRELTYCFDYIKDLLWHPVAEGTFPSRAGALEGNQAGRSTEE
jgi:hypothetical protein